MVNQSQYKDLLERARKRYTLAVDAEQEIRREFDIDLSFISGEGQWDAKIKREREQGPSPRPCLVFNKVLPPVTQLGNQARQNKPAIQVNPVDSAGDKDTAIVFQGMVRHIEYDSDADQAYDTALFYAAAGGFGYWMYECVESDPLSFDQDIRTVTIDDPLSIYLDCYAKKPDRSDMKWAFRIRRLSHDDHEQEYGEDTADLSSDFAKELASEGWVDDDSKRVAEYWEVTTVKKTLRMRKDLDGTVHPVYMEDLDKEEIDTIDGETGEPVFDWVLDETTGKPRESIKAIPKVMQYIINGAEVLEEPVEWDGDTIPIVIVTGLEVMVRGKRKLFSMTRFARDPQQLFNFYKTMEAETISLAPKPKWVGAVGQFKTKRRDWQRANTDNAAFLEYDPVAVGDKMEGPPKWSTFDPPIQALSIGALGAADDIKDSTGYADAQLGKNPRDQSGVAIEKLQAKGDISNFHFMDNLARGLKRGGRIVVQLIPKKYDTAREVRIIGEDQKQKVIKINAPFVDENGKASHYKLDVGKYDVAIRQGVSQDTQRIAFREMFMELSQGNPAMMQNFQDIFFENSDFPGADRMAARAKKMLPPALQDDDSVDAADIPPAIQSQMSQMKSANEQLQQQNQQLMSMVKGKLVEAQERSASAERINLERIESAERIANANNETRIETAFALSKSTSMNALAAMDHQAVKHDLDLRSELLHKSLTVEADAAQAAQAQQHERQMADQQRAHEQGMAAQGNQQDQDAQAQDQAHESTLQDADQRHQAGMATSAQDAAAVQQKLAQAAKPTAKPKK